MLHWIKIQQSWKALSHAKNKSCLALQKHYLIYNNKWMNETRPGGGFFVYLGRGGASKRRRLSKRQHPDTGKCHRLLKRQHQDTGKCRRLLKRQHPDSGKRRRLSKRQHPDSGKRRRLSKRQHPDTGKRRRLLKRQHPDTKI